MIDEKVKSSELSRTDFLIKALSDKLVIVIDCGSEILAEFKNQGNNLNQTIKNCYFGKIAEKELLSSVAENEKTYAAMLKTQDSSDGLQHPSDSKQSSQTNRSGIPESKPDKGANTPNCKVNEMRDYEKQKIDVSLTEIKKELSTTAKEIEKQRKDMKMQGICRKIFF